MTIDHAFLVLLAKSFGLLCFVVASVLVLVYALRPSSRRRFERAGRSIIDAEDRPADAGAAPNGAADVHDTLAPRTGTTRPDTDGGHAARTDSTAGG